MNATLQGVHLYLEDLTPGQQFSSPTMKVDAAQIKAFARQFDPQPFHVDEEVAGNSFFKGLAASGWHTAALTMRLLVESDLSIAGGIIGAGCEEIRWPQPVRPDDELHVRSEIIEVRRRDLLAASDQLAQARAGVALGAVKLFRALGGGWHVDDKPPLNTTPHYKVQT